MTSEELKAARITLKYSQAELAEALATPKRTVQDWERGKCRMPGVVAVAVGLLQEKDRWVMATIREQVAQRLDREWPRGIVSAADHYEAEGNE